MLFSGVYEGKTVLVTGHTGFKGSWLSLWLDKLGAKVVGISLDPISENSFFHANNINELLEDIRLDIRDLDQLKKIVETLQPDFVFHLAAQPLVKKSYEDPIETWTTNLIGTINILESLRLIKKECACVLITSDKCYDNKEWFWGYRETDKVGGPDPYSASKGAAELAINSYFKSFFPGPNSAIRISSARAGNVIGGGDWSQDRIVPDCIRAWSNGNLVKLRSPNSTRPWQHVLEPLSGYLLLGNQLYKKSEFNGEAFNFGPSISANYSVLELVKRMSIYWDQVKWEDCSEQGDSNHESALLKLNCDKALMLINWKSILSFEDTIKYTIEWYIGFLNEKLNISDISSSQIDEYVLLAKKNQLGWAK